LIIQGISLLNHPHPWRRLGVLNLCLAGLGFVSFGLMTSGLLVFGREFSVVMVEGSWARAGLFVLLVGLPVAAALTLHIVHAAATQARKKEQGDQQSEEKKLEPPEQSHERDKSVWLVVASIAIGPLAWICLRVLNESDPTQLKVYEYDLWWPPLVWWISMCIVGIGFAACPERLRRYWLVSCLAVSALLGFIAIGRWHLHHPYANPSTLRLWILCLSLSFPLLLGHMAWSIRIPW